MRGGHDRIQQHRFGGSLVLRKTARLRKHRYRSHNLRHMVPKKPPLSHGHQIALFLILGPKALDEPLCPNDQKPVARQRDIRGSKDKRRLMYGFRKRYPPIDLKSRRHKSGIDKRPHRGRSDRLYLRSPKPHPCRDPCPTKPLKLRHIKKLEQKIVAVIGAHVIFLSRSAHHKPSCASGQPSRTVTLRQLSSFPKTPI